MSSPFNTTSHRFKSFCQANNDISTPPSMDTRSGHIPETVDNIVTARANGTHRSAGEVKLQCCCGRPECAYLENNNTLLGGIERDLETAARLGQALLNRHESYVSESQLEHERLTAYIDQLEKERANLQTKNEKIVGENRELLNQLEAANTSLKDSDNHVKSLEALLRDCELEVRRLNGLSRRTEELELKILDMEKDRSILSQTVEDSKDETRSTIKRWKESEIKIRQLEYEVQKIEWEAKQEKERHEEIVARLERERVLERELGGAEGRLKSAAALQTLSGKSSGTNVVSHFVRDILKDNANLQAGITELRELLQASNEEVQNLREQILQHQPVEYDNPPEGVSRSLPLSEQLGWSEPSSKQIQQEVHVHHHYHAKIAGKRERTPTVRKSSRKRAVLGLGTLPSTSGSSGPTTPVAGPHRYVSSPILPITLHQPRARRNCWSVQSAATGSSMISSFPSSPRSYYERNSSIFDRLDAGDESSRPTSPESAAGFVEPLFGGRSRKVRADEGPADVLDEEEEEVHEAGDDLLEQSGPPENSSLKDDHTDMGVTEPGSRDPTPKASQILLTDQQTNRQIDPKPPDRGSTEDTSRTSIPEAEREPTGINIAEIEPGGVPLVDLPNSDQMSVSSNSFDLNGIPEITIQPSLRRSSSQDSLMSISGMDIHIPKRPSSSTSQSSSLLKGNKAYFALSPSAKRKFTAAQPLTTVTEFTASSSTRSFSANNTASADAGAGPETPERSASMSVEALSGLAGLPPSTSQEPQSSPSGIGRLIGGWVSSKWGIAPTKSSGDLRSVASVSTSSSTESQWQQPFQFPGGRLPGINQKGAIPGFRPPRRLSSTDVQVKMVDEEGLRESLAE
ncbi:uncharacterized protein Z518_02351 [Rhinocladiella mackenziei CBS 650.93]|uniref:Uncharacterized protein n=1 Tax=Rhinocladiella mackenziei CBS 650.93 TaxID=1442369 RepID=A0A0D2FZH5_9EURO|nr:uncharacterized protein Z518_02351 [Rhinocladiella mackenziei CBS 650.93]KIX07697.1 hypothetical protein Z518_02351 [Rhinocladiella mackenziei CBS 650.93]